MGSSRNYYSVKRNNRIRPDRFDDWTDGMTDYHKKNVSSKDMTPVNVSNFVRLLGLGGITYTTRQIFC